MCECEMAGPVTPALLADHAVLPLGAMNQFGAQLVEAMATPSLLRKPTAMKILTKSVLIDDIIKLN